MISWNTEYGSVLNKEISAAWDAALEAAERYGSYLKALEAMGGGLGINGDYSSGSSGNNNIVGSVTDNSGYTDEDMIKAIVNEMKINANNWHSATDAGKKKLDQRNYELGQQLHQYGIDAWRDDHEGVWYFDGYKELFKYYHTGGIAGGSGTLKQNEMMAVLENGEAILDAPKQGVLMRMIDSVSKLAKSIGSGVSQLNISRIFGGLSDGVTQIAAGNVVAPAGATPSISFGDTIIYGADDETVKKHQEISRKQVNDILDMFNLKK